MNTQSDAAILAIFGWRIARHGPNTRRNFYAVCIGADGTPSFETGPFPRYRDARHYINAMRGI